MKAIIIIILLMFRFSSGSSDDFPEISDYPLENGAQTTTTRAQQVAEAQRVMDRRNAVNPAHPMPEMPPPPQPSESFVSSINGYDFPASEFFAPVVPEQVQRQRRVYRQHMSACGCPTCTRYLEIDCWDPESNLMPWNKSGPPDTMVNSSFNKTL